MSLKYNILNVSYQQPQQQLQSDVKFRKTIKRYSEYTKKNKFSQPINQPHFHFQHKSNKKLSLYQQYKNKQMLRKIKKIDQRTHQGSPNKGKYKEKLTQIPNISINDYFAFQTVHSQLKPRTPSSKRKMTAPLIGSQPNCHRQLEGQQSSRGMGIIGVQSSFLDKYKLKTPWHRYSSSFNNDEEKDNRIKRRQILCSMKRNRTLEPKTVRDLEYKRDFSSKKQNCLSFRRDDRILCRPWSPSGEEQFQKL